MYIKFEINIRDKILGLNDYRVISFVLNIFLVVFFKGRWFNFFFGGICICIMYIVFLLGIIIGVRSFVIWKYML